MAIILGCQNCSRETEHKPRFPGGCWQVWLRSDGRTEELRVPGDLGTFGPLTPRMATKFLGKGLPQIPCVSSARTISSRVSSNGITPARVKISAKGVPLMDPLAPRREADADGIGTFLCPALLWPSAMSDRLWTLRELTFQVRARLRMH